MTTGICFLISIFFSPIFASIPPWATGCTLIVVRNPKFLRKTSNFSSRSVF
jgi:xanthine/uracil/vitamin C permease (AzgA family)